MLWGLLLVAFGILILIHRRKDAESLVRWQNDNFNTKFGNREVDIDAKVSILGGLAFIIAGTLVVLGVVDLR